MIESFSILNEFPNTDHKPSQRVCLLRKVHITNFSRILARAEKRMKQARRQKWHKNESEIEGEIVKANTSLCFIKSLNQFRFSLPSSSSRAADGGVRA